MNKRSIFLILISLCFFHSIDAKKAPRRKHSVPYIRLGWERSKLNTGISLMAVGGLLMFFSPFAFIAQQSSDPYSDLSPEQRRQEALELSGLCAGSGFVLGSIGMLLYRSAVNNLDKIANES